MSNEPQSHSLHKVLSRPQIHSRLIALLVERGMLDPGQAATLADSPPSPNDSLTRRLIDRFRLRESDVVDALATVAQVPVVNLAKTRIDDTILASVPPRIVARTAIMPVKRAEGRLMIASDDVPDVATADRLRLLLDSPLQWVLATPTEIRECINHYYGVGLAAYLTPSSSPGRRSAATGGAVAGEPAPHGDIPAFTSAVIAEAIRIGATDIHIEPEEQDLSIRFRIDGCLYPISLPAGVEAHSRKIISGLKVMGQMNVAERRLPQDGRFQFGTGIDAIDVRMSVLPTRHGETMNLRLLNRSTTFLTMEDLGIRPKQRPVFDDLVVVTHGMVLFTGPTGSGKSTSLYAALADLNTRERKIITLEDPVEYEMKGITQLPIHPDIGFTFASGLRSILRHDPDVVLVGEIRDNETAQIATSAALTGHLVFSTLHTNDAVSAISRLINMGVEPYLVASCVRGVIAQRLVRRLCPHCRKADVAPPYVRARVLDRDEKNGEETTTTVYRAVGCPHCRFTGYRGRQAIFEIVSMSHKLAALAAAKAPTQDLQQQAVREGLITLRQSGWERVLDGTTTVDEILRVTQAGLR